MAAKVSAGILLYRRVGGALEVLVAHPGGPYFARREQGAWTIPKGIVEEGETAEVAARREFAEETGFDPPPKLVELDPIRLKSGKRVHAFAGEGDVDPSLLSSNTFEMEWPPGSGKRRTFPEIDRVRFVPPQEARRLLNPAQAPLVDQLEAKLSSATDSSG
jgi:predicted NUDIX family NTP pyrophosphohydrolase